MADDASVRKWTEKKKFTLVYILTGVSGGIPNTVLDIAIITSIITQFGGDGFTVGMLGLITGITATVGVFLAPYFLQLLGSRKKMLMLCYVLALLSAMMITCTLAFVRHYAAVVLIIFAMSLLGMANTAMGLPLNDIMRRSVEDKKRIGIISNTIVGSLIASAFTGLVIKWVLDRSHLAFPLNYMYIFGGTMVCYGMIMCIISMIKETSDKPTCNILRNISFWGFYKDALLASIKDRCFIILTTSIIFYSLVCSSSGLYINLGYRLAPEMMKEMFATGLLLRILVKAAAYYLMGHIGKRFGNRVVIVLIGVMAFISPFTSLFLPFKYYILVFISTNLMPMYGPFFINHLMSMSSEDSFPQRYSILMLYPLPAALMAPWLGSLVEYSPLAFNLVVMIAIFLGIILISKSKPKKYGCVKHGERVFREIN